MKPFLKPDDIDLAISSGRCSHEILTEVSEFFRHCDGELPPFAVGDTAPKVCNKPAEVIDVGHERRGPNHVA